MKGMILAALAAVGLVFVTVATPPPSPLTRGVRALEVADVKTCGCPWTAKCGDCCGPDHCPCEKNPGVMRVARACSGPGCPGCMGPR